jgi:PAS domain S-box-containing protein
MDVSTALPALDARESDSTPPVAPSFAQTAQVSLLTGAAIFLIGSAVLCGWLLGIAPLQRILPIWAAMAPSTAFCFALAGLTLIAASLDDPASPRRFHPWPCRIAPLLIAAIAGAKLVEYVTGWPIGLDHLLLKNPLDADHPARMAIPTALGFVLAGISLSRVRQPGLKRYQLVVLLGGLIGWLGLSSYIFGRIPLIYFDAMAVHTATCFLLLNLGLLCLRPEGGVIGLFLRNSTGGVLARSLVPAILFVPLILAWLCLLGNRSGWFGVAGSASLFAIVNAAIFGGLIWKNAALLDRSDLERREAESRLVRKSAQLREQASLLEDANVIGWNLTEGIFFWNKGAQQLYGWTPEEAVGRSSHELLRTRFPKPFERIRTEFFAEGHWEGELVHRRRDGTEVVVASSWKLHRSERGGLASVVEVNNEITELKRAELKLRSQLEQLHLLDQITRAIAERQDLPSIFNVVIRNLEDNLPIDFGCVCLLEPGGNKLVVAGIGARGESLSNELGLKRQTAFAIDANGLSRCLAGHLVYESDTRVPPLPLPRRMARAGLRSLVLSPLLIEGKGIGVLIAARKEEKAFSSGECEFLRQLSEHVALASHQSQLYSALHNAYDDLRQTQQVLAQQERLRAFGEMASGMAHDINNTLSPVMLYTGLLLEQEQDLKPASRQHLLTIQRAIQDVSETIGRMKEFCRQREPQTNFAPVQLNVLVTQVVDLTRLRWHDVPRERGLVVEVKTDLARSLPGVMGVEGEIREAMVNLIFNAVDAMPRGGTLTIRTRTRDRNVVLEVTDSGTGMSEEVRQRCLEPFYTTKGDGGTGLGLAMVYGAAQRHSAELEIDSRPGQGTTMRLVFPAIPGDVPVAAETPGPAAPPRPMRILVVDDDPLLLNSLRDFLESDGHTVITAGGGQEGIHFFRESGDIDLVITDLGMPYVDGRAVAGAIKLSSPGTPVIMLTGWGKRMTSENDLPENIDRVLAKPPKLYELRAALHDFCAPTERT